MSNLTILQKIQKIYDLQNEIMGDGLTLAKTIDKINKQQELIDSLPDKQQAEIYKQLTKINEDVLPSYILTDFLAEIQSLI